MARMKAEHLDAARGKRTAAMMAPGSVWRKELALVSLLEFESEQKKAKPRVLPKDRNLAAWMA